MRPNDLAIIAFTPGRDGKEFLALLCSIRFETALRALPLHWG